MYPIAVPQLICGRSLKVMRDELRTDSFAYAFSQAARAVSPMSGLAAFPWAVARLAMATIAASVFASIIIFPVLFGYAAFLFDPKWAARLFAEIKIADSKNVCFSKDSRLGMPQYALRPPRCSCQRRWPRWLMVLDFLVFLQGTLGTGD